MRKRRRWTQCRPWSEAGCAAAGGAVAAGPAAVPFRARPRRCSAVLFRSGPTAVPLPGPAGREGPRFRPRAVRGDGGAGPGRAGAAVPGRRWGRSRVGLGGAAQCPAPARTAPAETAPGAGPGCGLCGPGPAARAVRERSRVSDGVAGWPQTGSCPAVRVPDGLGCGA